jgi:flagellar export protein FliJ
MGKRFKFSLAPVLKLREQARELSELRLSEARGVVDRERDGVRNATAQEQAVIRSIHDNSGGPLDVTRMRLLRRHLAGVQRTRHAKHVALNKAGREMEIRRVQLQHAAREALAVEKLRDAKLSEHRREENAAEQRALDEAAGMLAQRKEPPCTD